MPSHRPRFDWCSGFTRPGDGWRREVLTEDLSRVLARGLHEQAPSTEELRWCERNKNEPTVCLWLARPDVTRVVRAAVHGPKLKINKTAGGTTTLTFADPAFAKAWRSRPQRARLCSVPRTRSRILQRWRRKLERTNPRCALR